MNKTYIRQSIMDMISIIVYGLVTICIILLVLFLYRHYKTYKIAYYDEAVIISNEYNATKHKVVPSSQIPSPLQGNEYAVSMWLYVTDYAYQYGQPKQILYRGIEKDNKIDANPHIYLHPTESTLMVRIKLQSNTVPDPNSHLKKVTVADSVSNWVSNEVIKSNVSGNNIDTSGNNVIGNNVENFYSGLGTPYLQGRTSMDDMAHHYSLVGTSNYNLENFDTQMKEMFETNDVLNSQNTPNSLSDNNSINGIGANAINADIVANTNTDMNMDMDISGLDANFLKNNPFIATFIDKFSKATSNEEGMDIASDYASQFVEKTPEERQVLADQFFKTLAKTFATSMGLKIVDEETETAQLASSNDVDLYDTCYLRDIPLQKWTNVIVSVFQNSVDIYQDGKLVSSCNLKGFPKPNQHPVHIAPNLGFNGFLSNTKFLNMAVTPDNALMLYQEGPSVTPSFFGTFLDKIRGTN